MNGGRAARPGSDEHGPSLPVPMERLCDPANWGYVCEHLEPMRLGVHRGDPRDLMDGILVAANHYRYWQRLSPRAGLAALASPWLGETNDPYRAWLRRHDITLRSFGVERDKVAIIDPERYRYFTREDGWSARFTLPVPGLLVTLTEETEEQDHG